MLKGTTVVIIGCGVIKTKSADKSFSWGYNIGFKPIKINLQSPLINLYGCSDTNNLEFILENFIEQQ